MSRETNERSLLLLKYDENFFSDGWIVTSGFKTGVVQLVGEAIHDHKVTNPRSRIIAVGCSKWGATRNRDALITVKMSHWEKRFCSFRFCFHLEKIVESNDR